MWAREQVSWSYCISTGFEELRKRGRDKGLQETQLSDGKKAKGRTQGQSSKGQKRIRNRASLLIAVPERCPLSHSRRSPHEQSKFRWWSCHAAREILFPSTCQQARIKPKGDFKSLMSRPSAVAGGPWRCCWCTAGQSRAEQGERHQWKSLLGPAPLFGIYLPDGWVRVCNDSKSLAVNQWANKH